MQYSGLVLVAGKNGFSYFGMHRDDYYSPSDQNITLHFVDMISTVSLNRALGEAFVHLANQSETMTAWNRSHMLFNTVMVSAGSRGVSFTSLEKLVIPTNQISRLDPLPKNLEFYHNSHIKEKTHKRVR